MHNHTSAAPPLQRQDCEGAQRGVCIPERNHSPECVFVLTETRAFTVHAIFARLAHPVPAVWTTEARLTETASINVVAACTISTVTHTFTVLTIGACSTVLVTPEGRTQKSIWIQKVLFHGGKSA